MVQNVVKHTNWFILLLLAVSILLIVTITQLGFQRVAAQETSTNMRYLFEKIEKQMTSDSGFLVAIQFVTPIVEGEKTWVLPDTREKPNDEVSISISEIDDDYVCFDSLRGSARYIECTPYTNIASIRYFVQ
jgi:hypothetical protein